MGTVTPQPCWRSVWCSLQKRLPFHLSYVCLPASQSGSCFSSRISAFINCLFVLFFGLTGLGIKPLWTHLPHPQAWAGPLLNELMKTRKHLQPLSHALCWAPLEWNHLGQVCGCCRTSKKTSAGEAGRGGHQEVRRVDWLLGGWNSAEVLLVLQSSCDRVVSGFETCFTLSCNQTVIRSRNKLMKVWLCDRLTMKGTIFRVCSGDSVSCRYPLTCQWNLWATITFFPSIWV